MSYAREKRPCGPLLFLHIYVCRIVGSGLDAFDVLCLPALGAFDYVELDLLTFLQTAETIRLDRGEMNKYVFPILAADESIALGIVKPLYGSCFHGVTVFLLLKYALELAGSCRQVTLWSGLLLNSRKDQTLPNYSDIASLISTGFWPYSGNVPHLFG
jgi:hypothetical protein